MPYQQLVICIFCLLAAPRSISPSANAPTPSIGIDLRRADFQPMSPEFWLNTGFCPPAPTDRAAQLVAFFNGVAVRRQMDALSALPVASGGGRPMVRAHWLLNLIGARLANDTHPERIVYDFRRLDTFLDHLVSGKLVPVIEVMGNPSGILRETPTSSEFWRDLMERFVRRYIGRYGWATVREWRFETWNEPDLRGFNVLGFDFKDYMHYITGTLSALHTISPLLQLRGPAGLFRPNHTRHPLCWGLLHTCNTLSAAECPIQTITYHRKGAGTAASILNGSLDLLAEFRPQFPRLAAALPYANTEADPTSGWSHPQPGNADVSYAAVLAETVLLHWRSRHSGQLAGLLGLSHDNAFVAYHPHEFTQRTLFAVFRMNRTATVSRPADVQLIAKPVYIALGMLAQALGDWTALPVSSSNSPPHCLWVVSGETDAVGNGLATAVVLVSAGSNVSQQQSGEREQRDRLRVEITGLRHASSWWTAEYLEAGSTDPHRIWVANGRPAYPDAELRRRMRRAQGPFVLVAPRVQSTRSLKFDINLARPWLVTIRICPAASIRDYKIINFRADRVNQHELQLFWYLNQRSSRCITGYRVYYRRHRTADRWQCINRHQPTSFMSYHHCIEEHRNAITSGYYSVRAQHISGQLGPRSRSLAFNN